MVEIVSFINTRQANILLASGEKSETYLLYSYFIEKNAKSNADERTDFINNYLPENCLFTSIYIYISVSIFDISGGLYKKIKTERNETLIPLGAWIAMSYTRNQLIRRCLLCKKWLVVFMLGSKNKIMRLRLVANFYPKTIWA